ncbi:hypothetical protein BC7_00038 [Bacillus phage BC-7]|nr:hypothetical protein BC7_00038 [Bacillus phage BC-7]
MNICKEKGGIIMIHFIVGFSIGFVVATWFIFGVMHYYNKGSRKGRFE